MKKKTKKRGPGRPPGDPTDKITIRMRIDMLNSVRRAADQDGRNFTQEVHWLLNAGLKRRRPRINRTSKG